MTTDTACNFTIRTFQPTDSDKVISIWQQCGLVKSWNNPSLDIQRKLSFQKKLFFVGELSTEIIATAMFGYDGHRGWLHYFAVLPRLQRRGFGRQMVEFGEAQLIAKGCPKLNFQIRVNNTEAINFYQRAGYKEDAVVSFGKRLIDIITS